MLASIYRRRRLILALRQISAGGDGGAKNLIHPSPSTVLLSHLCSLTAVAPNSEPCLTTVSYLVSCGVSPAIAAVRKVRIRDTEKADAVRDLLRKYGFSDAEVTLTVHKEPRLLTFDPDRRLRPKLDFLRGILGTEGNFRLAISRNPRALTVDVDKTMRPAVEAFRRHGLSKESIAKLLRINLCMLFMRIDRITEAFEDLKELGMCVKHTNFLYVFRVMCSLRRETWQRKVSLFGSFGVTEDVLIRVFKTQPTILLLNEETIKKKVRFFLDVLKLELNSIMQQPSILTVSLEKCVKPRCAVLSQLIREGKLEQKPKLLASLFCSAQVFSERFVLKYANEVPDVVKAFEGKIKFEGFEDRELEKISS